MNEVTTMDAQVDVQETEVKKEKPKFKEKLKNAWDKSKGIIIPVTVTAAVSAVVYFGGKKFFEVCDDKYKLDLSKLLASPPPEEELKMLTTKEVKSAVKAERNLGELDQFIQTAMNSVRQESVKYGVNDIGVMWSSCEPDTPLIEYYINDIYI